MKFFSIAIPTYEMNGKGSEFLNFSLDILDKQTFKDFEVVISDHSLNDDIKNVVNDWDNSLDIKYFRNEYKRGGSSPNINNAIKNCTGSWIKILFQDDYLYNADSLKILKTHIDIYNQKEWVVTACEHSNDGISMYKPFFPSWTNDIHLGNNSISSPSVITIKNSNDKLYFDDNLLWLMDVEYYKRMNIKYGQPSYLQEINVVNRTWNNSVSSTISQERKNSEIYMVANIYASN